MAVSVAFGMRFEPHGTWVPVIRLPRGQAVECRWNGAAPA